MTTLGAELANKVFEFVAAQAITTRTIHTLSINTYTKQSLKPITKKIPAETLGKFLIKTNDTAYAIFGDRSIYAFSYNPSKTTIVDNTKLTPSRLKSVNQAKAISKKQMLSILANQDCSNLSYLTINQLQH